MPVIGGSVLSIAFRACNQRAFCYDTSPKVALIGSALAALSRSSAIGTMAPTAFEEVKPIPLIVAAARFCTRK